MAAVLAAAAPGRAATISVISHDAAGEGLNDPTPVAPVGGNPGTTLGAQRLHAFQHAADIWGALVQSTVEIRVAARFDPLPCSAWDALLGSAGPVTAARDFAGAPAASTWYPIALANALRGADLAPGQDDISAVFNSAIGTSACPFPFPWYYGIDGRPPGGQLDFVTVVLHELGHGLGFISFVDIATGARLSGMNDTYMRYLLDHATGKLFPEMTDVERAAASAHTGNLHWIGAHARNASGVLATGRVGDHVQMFAPNPPQPGSSVGHFDTSLSPSELMEPSYTGSLHAPGLALPLLADIGWPLATAGAEITATPSALTFGGVPVGGKSAPLSVTVQNTGTAAVDIGVVGMGGANPGQFKRATDLCSGTTLAPATSCTVAVKFKPKDGGIQDATLAITPVDPTVDPVTVTLGGTGLGPEVAVDPSAIDFGAVAAGGGVLAATVTVRNDGTANLSVLGTALGGPDAAQFAKPAAKDLCAGRMLPPGGSCTLKVKFKPTISGALTATLLISTDDFNEAVAMVMLNGVGTP